MVLEWEADEPRREEAFEGNEADELRDREAKAMMFH
jgi:hypothetical protein